jgi:predicted AlkP superfamily phosphohydrolase/phosphomutase
MKICIIGLDNATPEVIFQDERLTNLRRLMDVGLYGVVPSIRSATGGWAWQCMLASQNAISADSQSLWQILAGHGKNCLLAASPKHLSADQGESLSHQNLDLSREQWQEANRCLTTQEWDAFQFIDFGLTRLVEQASQPDAAAGDGDTEGVVSDYYAWIDEQIGMLMELMDDQTILLVASAGSQQLPTQPGLFLLAAPNCPISGEYDGATLLDLAPTLLDLAGYQVPTTMQGRSLVAGMDKLVPGEEDQEKIIYDRLAGLGYV